MSVRRANPALPKGAATEAPASKLRDVLSAQPHSYGPKVDISAGIDDALQALKVAEPTEQHFMAIQPPAGLSPAETDAWYDGIVQAAEKAKAGAKKLAKDIADNTTQPRTTPFGRGKIVAPLAIEKLYTMILNHPGDANDVAQGISTHCMKDFFMENAFTGGKCDSADDFVKEVSALGQKVKKLTFEPEVFMELSPGDWIPASGWAKGIKGYAVVSKVTGDKLAGATNIDLIFLVRDAKDRGEWKMKRLIHGGTLLVKSL